jgi:hypothetical protein
MASPPLPADLVRSVVDAYRRRAGVVPEYHAWVAAREAVRRHRPELEEQEAGLIATQILAAEADPGQRSP